MSQMIPGSQTIPGAMPLFPDEDRASILAGIDAVLRSGQLTQGPHVRAFEAACAAMAGTRHAVAVNSGGTALELALAALDVAGAEVLVPTETFVATANAVVRAGATPVFLDIDPATLAPTADGVARCIGPRTRVLVLVHMFGLMSPEIPAIRALCADRGVALMEDAAHAHGASQGGLRAGGLGRVGCFSYYATKILTTGEGGVVTTDDDAIAARVACLRDHGRGPDGQTFVMAGNNFRMAEIPALIGIHQQRRLDEAVAHRRRIAAVYREGLACVDGLRIVDPAPHDGHAYWRYAVVLDPGIDRDRVQAAMAGRFGTRVTWMYEPLCHEQPFFRDRPEGAVSLPCAEGVRGRLVNLPTHAGVSEAAAGRIVDGLRTILAEER